MTTGENIVGVRRRLGQPLQDSPNDGLILQALVDQLQHHIAQLNASSAHWNVAQWQLDVSNGTEDYQITETSFGRPFLVYTVDSTDTYHIRTEIPITMLQNADKRYIGAQKALSTAKHTASQMCFYKTDQTWYIRPVPIPAGSSSYVIWYEKAYEYASPSETTGIEAFHHLVRVQAALSVLPFCEWRGATKADDARTWSVQMQVLERALLRDEMKYQQQFNEYRSQLSREGVSNKLMYGWMQEDDAFGIGRMVGGYGL